MDASGTPVKNALVEIWHADDGGNYIYSANQTRNPAADSKFARLRPIPHWLERRVSFPDNQGRSLQRPHAPFHLGVTFPGQRTRYTTQTFWNEIAYAPNGSQWATQNSNDMVLQGISNTAQRASVILNYTPVPGTTTGEVMANYDLAAGFTPAEPTYPGGGSLLTQGALVAGPTGAYPRFKLTFPTYTGYTYEVYGDETLADLAWKALPFSLTQTGAIDRNRFTATADGALSIYVQAKALKDFYKVSFRVPGANTGMP